MPQEPLALICIESRTSGTLTQQVTSEATGTYLYSSQNPSATGNYVTLTVQVAGAFGDAPVGNVTIKDNGSFLQYVALTPGNGASTGTLPVQFTTPGTHNLTATCNHNPNYPFLDRNNRCQSSCRLRIGRGGCQEVNYGDLLERIDRRAAASLVIKGACRWPTNQRSL